MTITINGSGTVTGVSVGGLPDNIITNAELADDAIGIADLSATGTASSSTFLRGDNTWAAGGTTRTIASADASSGSEVEFASLDADAYWHRAVFFKVSVNGNTDIRSQAGTSSAYLTANYKTSCGYLAGGSSTAVDGDTGWIRTDGLTAAADTQVWELNYIRSGTTNNWVVRGSATHNSTNYFYWITSNFELSAALSKIKFYAPNLTFDAGNIYLESFK